MSQFDFSVKKHFKVKLFKLQSQNSIVKTQEMITGLRLYVTSVK